MQLVLQYMLVRVLENNKHKLRSLSDPAEGKDASLPLTVFKFGKRLY